MRLLLQFQNRTTITLYTPVKRVLITNKSTAGKKKNPGGIIINPTADRYKYMSIRQLQDITAELKDEAKHDPAQDAEYHVAYKALQDKIRERDRNRQKCIPWRFEHDLDVGEEF